MITVDICSHFTTDKPGSTDYQAQLVVTLPREPKLVDSISTFVNIICLQIAHLDVRMYLRMFT